VTSKGLFWQKQVQCIVEIGEGAFNTPFNILTNVQYYQVKVARDETYKKALEVGLVKTIKRFDVLTIGEEK
jgi:hypothetical protein